MHYVYHIQSLSHPNKSYTGFSADLKQRIKNHNEGSGHAFAPKRLW